MQARLEQLAGKFKYATAMTTDPDLASLIQRAGTTATTYSAMVDAGIGQDGAQHDFSLTNSDVVTACKITKDPISEHPSS
jgi:hypothetical protein